MKASLIAHDISNHLEDDMTEKEENTSSHAAVFVNYVHPAA